MKAIVHDRYGPPAVLRLEEVPDPIVGDDDVLVRIHAASVNAGDWHLMRADPFFIRMVYGGLLKPKFPILGSDIAGTVEAIGRNVTQFRPGDEVFGDLAESGFGAFAEFACAPEAALAHKPANTTFREAAAVPVAGIAALQALRDKGRIRAGQRVVVNGASGGVGTFAVQVARSYGAEVTGVCSTRNMDMVRSIGADQVIDYTNDDYTRIGREYDLIVDAAAFGSVRRHLRALAPGGAYVMIGGGTAPMFQVMALGPWVARTGKRVEFLTSKPRQEDLDVLKELIEAGDVSPVIDRHYTLPEVPEAVRYVEAGHTQGKVVINL